MKLWKKIVLIASTLIVIISSMVLPCFADSWANVGSYPDVSSIGAKYDVNLIVKDKLHNRTLQYDIETNILMPGSDIMQKPTQTLTGRMTANPIRNSVYSEGNEHSLQYEVTLHNRFISTSNPSQSKNGGYFLQYNNIGEPSVIDNGIAGINWSELTLTIDNYIWHYSGDRIRPELTLRVPDLGSQSGEYLNLKTHITALRPIFNYDDNNIYFEPVDIIWQKVYSVEDLSTAKTINIVPETLDSQVKPAIIFDGKRSEIASPGYVFLENITVSIKNAKTDLGVDLDRFGLRLPCNTVDKTVLGSYRDVLAPDDYDGYMSIISAFRLKDMSARIETDGFWDFIEQSVGSFFDFEIIPNISIGGIILGIVALLLFIMFLKIFAGG